MEWITKYSEFHAIHKFLISISLKVNLHGRTWTYKDGTIFIKHQATVSSSFVHKQKFTTFKQKEAHCQSKTSLHLHLCKKLIKQEMSRMLQHTDFLGRALRMQPQIREKSAQGFVLMSFPFSSDGMSWIDHFPSQNKCLSLNQSSVKLIWACL